MKYKYSTHSKVYSDEVKNLQSELSKYGYLSPSCINGYYDLNTEKSFKAFQKKNDEVPNGIFDTTGFSIEEISKVDNNGKLNRSNQDLEPGGGEVGLSDGSGNSSSLEEREMNPFFNDSKGYVFRKGEIDILIEYANSTKQRRKIEGVKIRSMSQIVDTNGEAIADVYNFVARDLIEFNN